LAHLKGFNGANPDVKPAEATEDEPLLEVPRKIIIVTNWFEELKQRVPD
jgi:hypothetical protein